MATEKTCGTFRGAKVAILVGAEVVTLLRDARPDIPWPGWWDLPGGGREGRETPFDTVRRETEEEVGLRLDPARIVHEAGDGESWFFVALWPDLRPDDLVLGDEGQAVRLMPVEAFLSRGDVIPKFQARLRDYLSG